MDIGIRKEDINDRWYWSVRLKDGTYYRCANNFVSKELARQELEQHLKDAFGEDRDE